MNSKVKNNVNTPDIEFSFYFTFEKVSTSPRGLLLLDYLNDSHSLKYYKTIKNEWAKVVAEIKNNDKSLGLKINTEGISMTFLDDAKTQLDPTPFLILFNFLKEQIGSIKLISRIRNARVRFPRFVPVEFVDFDFPCSRCINEVKQIAYSVLSDEERLLLEVNDNL